MTIKQAKSLIVQSKFSEALSLLEKLEKQQSDEILNVLEILTLDGIIKIRTRNVSSVLFFDNKIRPLLESIRNKKPGVNNLCDSLNNFLAKKESQNSIHDKIKALPNYIKEKVPVLIFQQINFIYSERRKQREYDYPVDSVDFKIIYTIFKEFDDRIYILEILLEIIWANLYRWENKMALDLAYEYLKNSEEINDPYCKTLAFCSIAVIYADIGNCKESINYSFKYLHHAKNLGVINILWHSNFTLALHFAYAADISNALKYDEECYTLERHPEFTDISTVPMRELIAIHIMWKKGDVDLALNNMLDLLEGFESRKHLFSIAMAYGVLANIYYQKGDLEQASSYFKKSLKIREEFGAHTILTDNYFHLLEINLQQGNIKTATEYLNKIREIREETDEIWVDQLYSLSEALIHKTSQDDISKSKAKSILNDLVLTEFPYHVTTDRAYLHLCDLILEEIKSTENLALIETLHNYIKELTLKATLIQSNLLLIELYFLQSKILLLDLKIDEAISLLEQAQELAREKGITRLEILISNEYDLLLEQLDKWEDLTTYLPTLEERFEITHIEDFLNGMIRSWIRYSDIVQEEESPYFFVILDKLGSIVFSNSFSSQSLDYVIISEIFSRINEIKQKKDLNQKPIRFRYRAFYCLLLKIKDFFFCYIFMGKSFQAIKKFLSFFDEFSKTPLEKELSEKWLAAGTLNLDIRTQLSELIENNFLSRE
jgi:tetratricopeptide (TPR) repeat protein